MDHTAVNYNNLEFRIDHIENKLDVMEEDIVRNASNVVITSSPHHYGRNEFFCPALVCLHRRRQVRCAIRAA